MVYLIVTGYGEVIMKKNHKILISVGIIAVVIIGGIQVNNVLAQRPVLAASTSQFDKGNELLTSKNYLMAITAFKEVVPKDKKRFDLAQEKIKESKKLYVEYLFGTAKGFAEKKNYDKAITYLDMIAAFDPNVETATQKTQYIVDKGVNDKVISEAAQVKAAADKVIADAEAKVKEAADAKANAAAKVAAKSQGVILGMTMDEVINSSWGKPWSVNRSVYSFGTHEQWVYGTNPSNYLYFENGILTSLQN